MIGLLGQTPLIRWARLFGSAGAPRVYAKFEAANPSGSAKDRPAALMLRRALERGELRPGDTVIESSSGNLGVALAQWCAWEGLDFLCVVDPRTNDQNLRLIQAYGGRLHHVTEPDPISGDWLRARRAAVARLLRTIPRSWSPDQYSNDLNPVSHDEGTIREIVEELNGEITALMIATSTTGTLVGAQRCLASTQMSTELIAVDAVGSVLFGGTPGVRRLPGLGAGVEPHLSMEARPDRVRRVSDLDCVIGCRRVAQREALLVGASTGGIVTALGRELSRFGPTDTVVVIAHDTGARYLDTVFDDAWVSTELGCSRASLQHQINAGHDAA